MRIASLVPAATDLICELGLATALVGISHECDHPRTAGLPVLTAASIPAAGLDATVDPADVDRQVGDALAAGDALYRTDLARLRALEPDVIVGQQICDVCAVSSRSIANDLPAGAQLVTLTAMTIDMLWDDIGTLGAACAVPDRATSLIERTRRRLGAVATSPTRPTVATIEWGDPPFIGGHWVPEAVELSGGQHLMSRPGEPSRPTSWDAIVEAAPDIVVYLPCGYLIDVAAAEAERTVPPALQERTWVMDANRLVSRCTTAIADAVEALACVVRGDVANHADIRPLRP